MNSDRMESPVVVTLRSDGSNYSVWKGSMETSFDDFWIETIH